MSNIDIKELMMYHKCIMQFSFFFHVFFYMKDISFCFYSCFYDLPVWCSGVTSLNFRRWFDSRMYLKSKIYIVNALNHKLFFFENKNKISLVNVVKSQEENGFKTIWRKNQTMLVFHTDNALQTKVMAFFGFHV